MREFILFFLILSLGFLLGNLRRIALVRKALDEWHKTTDHNEFVAQKKIIKIFNRMF